MFGKIPERTRDYLDKKFNNVSIFGISAPFNTFKSRFSTFEFYLSIRVKIARHDLKKFPFYSRQVIQIIDC
jgi:hypothetical protein